MSQTVKEATSRLHELADDFDRYEVLLRADPDWRAEMQRAVLREIEGEMLCLHARCKAQESPPRPRGLLGIFGGGGFRHGPDDLRHGHG